MTILLPATARRPVSGPQREESGRVVHPDHLAVDGRALTLVDDPLVEPIAVGHPVLGWEGDHRLALYIDRRRGEWTLVRKEADGVYRIVAVTDPIALQLAPVDVVGRLIQWLVEHDGRRGFDPMAAVDAHNTALEASREAAFEDRSMNDLAPRLKHALRKDLG